MREVLILILIGILIVRPRRRLALVQQAVVLYAQIHLRVRLLIPVSHRLLLLINRANRPRNGR